MLENPMLSFNKGLFMQQNALKSLKHANECYAINQMDLPFILEKSTISDHQTYLVKNAPCISWEHYDFWSLTEFARTRISHA